MRSWERMERDRIWDAAEGVRAEFETCQVPRELLSELYYAYNPEVEIEEFIDLALRQFPAWNCGLATIYLRHLIGGEAIQGSYADEDHTFLYRNSFIADITADQFGGPPIYVGPFRPPWAE